MIVEPTGAALLSRIIDNLSRITYGDISLLPPVTLVSPRGIDQSMACFGDIYADQLKAAEQIIFSKCENEDPGALRLTKEKLLKTAPSARVAAEHYSRMGEEWWLGLLGAESRPARLSKNTAMIFQNLDGGPWDMPGGRIASPYPQIYSAICH